MQEVARSESDHVRFGSKAERVTEALPEYETDRKDDSEIAIRSCGRRRRQWRGTCEQGKRLGIEYRRAGTLDDPAVQHVTADRGLAAAWKGHST